MNTNARTSSPDGSHWYSPDGKPCYEVPYADPKKGNRPTTLADARKLALLPSVTTILRSLHKQALVDWLVEQACLAVLTSPRKDGEDLDAFVQRVLHVERVQDQESEAAKDRGTLIHNAMEAAFSGKPVASEMSELWPWIEKPFVDIGKRGKVIGTEVIVCGNGYGGKIDLVQETDHEVWLWDWKTSKKLPKGEAWPEHRLQLAAYATAWARGDKPIRTANCYISTVDQGLFVVCEHEDWRDTYGNAFKPLVSVWQWLNSYRP